MKQIIITALCAGLSCVAAEQSRFPKLPDSPSKLIGILKGAGDRYTIGDVRVDYVKESDLPYLVGLLDSKEPCAFLDMSTSSILYPGKSSVGHEAAYLIEGFWRRYYPTDLTSQLYKPDVEGIKHWYQRWSHLKKLAEEDGAASGSPPSPSATNRTSSGLGSVDPKLAEKAEVVLRGTRLTPGGGSKYLICEVQVSKVYTNRSGRSIGKSIEVAAYSFRPGVPTGSSTFYLERYNETNTNLWRLVGGEASTGISHNEK